MKNPLQYIGIDMINAEPMTLGKYNTYRGWTIPENENPDRLGYLITYADGHITWNPKESFEKTYQSTQEGLPFSMILELVKNYGSRAARKGWNGKDMFIFLVPGSTFEVNREPLLTILGQGTKVNYHSHIDMRTANGQIVPWLASQTDLLANDWMLV